MEEKTKKFLNFDWDNCESWKKYYEQDLYPKPTKEEIIFHYKKKFYKNKIDPDFDDKFIPIEDKNNINQSKNANQTFCQHNKHEQISKKGITDNVLSSIEAVLWVSYFMNIFLQNEIKKYVLFTLCLRIFTLYKNKYSSQFFSFTKENFDKILKELNIQLILYVLTLFLAPKLNYLFLFPISITAILSICDYFVNFLRIFKFTKKYFEYVLEKSDYLYKLQAFSYILIGFLITFGLIIRWYGIVHATIYIFYLRILYKYNSDARTILGNIKRWTELKISHNKCPKIIKFCVTKIINVIEKLK